MGATAADDGKNILAALVQAGLVGADEHPSVTALTGGVSCDVFRVDLASGPVCVKRALPRLRVAADWRAPVERIHNEVAWLKFAATVAADCVPAILAEDRTAHLFAMSYLAPEEYPVWKSLLLEGEADPAFAGMVGETLVRIHAASAGRPDLARRFDNGPLFHALRIEPYLLHTALAHPDRAEILHGLARDLAIARMALMQGDISPKNILKGPSGPVFLDAETACYGDPAFDLAFCLNHLLLKCVWRPSATEAYGACFAALKNRYLAGVRWEKPESFARRTAQLLAAFLLARIDGKSPVEYINADADKDRVRTFARAALVQRNLTLDSLWARWQEGFSR